MTFSRIYLPLRKMFSQSFSIDITNSCSHQLPIDACARKKGCRFKFHSSSVFGNSTACETSAMLRGWGEKIIFPTSDECVHTIYIHTLVRWALFFGGYSILPWWHEGCTHRSHGKPMKGLRSSVWISWLISMWDIRIFRIYCLFDVSIVYAGGFFSDADARAVMKMLKFSCQNVQRKCFRVRTFFWRWLSLKFKLILRPFFLLFCELQIFFGEGARSGRQKVFSFQLFSQLTLASAASCYFFQFSLPCECWVCVKA